MLACKLLCAVVVSGVLAANPATRAEELPSDAKKALELLERDVAAIHKKTEDDIKLRQKQGEAELAARLAKTVESLKQLQDIYTKSGKLDEAVAIRERIKTLSVGAFALTPLPKNFMDLRGQSGKVLYIEVVGSSGEWVYGTDIYTDDTPLSAAVVHAGVLKNGEKGIVKVTLLPSQASFAGSLRNGISSYGWGAYGGAYKVEPTVKIGASTPPAEVKKQ